MKDTRSIDIKKLQARARWPVYLRAGAISLFVIALLVVGIGFYRGKDPEFRMLSFPTSLSKDVVASVNSYERREGDRYYIKADKATTFADNHQELENVYLQIFKPDGAFDQITSAKAVYIPEENKNFTGYFAGNVNIETRDKFRLNTEQITYKRADETAVAEEAVTFERLNLKGSSFGGVVNMANRTVELSRDVEFQIANGSGGSDKINAGSAVYFQNEGRAEFTNGVHVVSTKLGGEGKSEVSDATATRVVAMLKGDTDSTMSLEKAEFYDNVKFVQSKSSATTTITAGIGVYEKPLDKVTLNHAVSIQMAENGSVLRTMTGDNAVYSGTSGRAEIVGNAHAVAGPDWVKGDRINADLLQNGKFKNIEVVGNAALHQVRGEESTDIVATRLTAEFTENGTISKANAVGQSEVKRVSPGASNMTIVAASGIESVFRGEGLFDKLRTDGRTVINFETPDNGRDSANRQIAADALTSSFNVDGKSLKRAEAIGNAEFGILPHRATETNYRVKVNAPRIDCDFYGTGNSLNLCVASSNAKLVRTPMTAKTGRGDQVVTATSLTSKFDQSSGNISQLDAAGKAKFNELDRNASANAFTFTANDEIVRLRGGEPTGWDSRARVKAKEIDWDTKNARSSYRGNVSSTYYSSKGIGDASPFGSSDKPVFITSESAEMSHNEEMATYSGNARAWQGSNFVRGTTISISQKDSRMIADGNVQSAIFGSRAAGGSDVPIFASAAKMTYDGTKRTVKYEEDVSVKKGTDRITGRTATVWLNEKNEMTATDFENNVTIVQPGRNGSGDFARYTSADEKMVLRGRPAKVEDPEKGSLAGAELTIFLKDKRVLGNGVTPDNPTGRVRNTYKIQ